MLRAHRFGEGRLGYLSPATVDRLDRWLKASGIDAGPIFRAVFPRSIAERRFHCYEVTRILRRAAAHAGLDADTVGRLFGHSMRVGAALARGLLEEPEIW